MILCPKCGKVEKYHIKESAHRVKIFNKNNECVEITKYTDFRYDLPRCLKCGSIVMFYTEPQEENEVRNECTRHN